VQQVNNKGLQIRLQKWFKKYTLVHFVQVAYTRGLIEQNERIRIHALSQKEKRVWDGKSRFWSKVLVRGIDPKWFWSEVLRKA